MRLGGWRLLVPLVVVQVALFAQLNGVLAVLLPQRVAELVPHDKVAALAVISSISFAVTAAAQPSIGALSDRTRSRLGRRIPWMLAGAVAGGVAVGLMAGAGSVVVLAVLWAVGQFLLNGTDIATTAYLVDGFERRRRGRIAGAMGVAAIAGGALGAIVAAALSARVLLAHLALAGALVVAVLVFAVLVRDAPSRFVTPASRQRLGIRRLVDAVRGNPAFAWIFAWRLCFAIGAGALQGYLLYILTDHVGVPDAEAGSVVGLATALGAVFVIVAVIVGGWLSDRTGRRKPFLVAAGAIVAVAALVPLFAPSVTSVLILAGAVGLGLGVAISCGTALAADAIVEPEQHAGGGLGLFNVATNVGQAVAPLVAAAAIASVGGYPLLFGVAALLMAASSALLVPVRETPAR